MNKYSVKELLLKELGLWAKGKKVYYCQESTNTIVIQDMVYNEGWVSIRGVAMFNINDPNYPRIKRDLIVSLNKEFLRVLNE